MVQSDGPGQKAKKGRNGTAPSYVDPFADLGLRKTQATAVAPDTGYRDPFSDIQFNPGPPEQTIAAAPVQPERAPLGTRAAAALRSFLPQPGEGVLHTAGRDVVGLGKAIVEPFGTLTRGALYREANALGAAPAFAQASGIEKPTLKQEALAAPQVAVTALAGPAEHVVNEGLTRGAAALLGEDAVKGFLNKLALHAVAAPIVGAPAGAIYNPSDPGVGALTGTILSEIAPVASAAEEGISAGTRAASRAIDPFGESVEQAGRDFANAQAIRTRRRPLPVNRNAVPVSALPASAATEAGGFAPAEGGITLESPAPLPRRRPRAEVEAQAHTRAVQDAAATAPQRPVVTPPPVESPNSIPVTAEPAELPAGRSGGPLPAETPVRIRPLPQVRRRPGGGLTTDAAQTETQAVATPERQPLPPRPVTTEPPELTAEPGERMGPVSVGPEPPLGPQPVASSNGRTVVRPDVMRRVNRELPAEPVEPPRLTEPAGEQHDPFAEIGDLKQQLAESEERRNAAEREARTDKLTGLANRAALDEHATKAPVGTKWISLDLDNFKAQNDTHGEAFGDQLIQEAGQSIRQSSGDRFVARRGGDEYYVAVEPGDPYYDDVGALRDKIESDYGVREYGGIKTSMSGEVFDSPEEAATEGGKLKLKARKLVRKAAQGMPLTRAELEAQTAGLKGEAPTTEPAVEHTAPPEPEDVLNVAKLNLSETGEARVRHRLEQFRAQREANRQTFAEADVNRAEIVKDLSGGDPIALSTAKAKRLSGEELLARRDIVSQNDALIESLSSKLADPNLTVEESAQASELLRKAVAQNDALLSDLVTGSSQKGRDLNLLRRIANRSLDPVTWEVQAKRLLGDKPLTDAIRADIRRLAKAAADACGGGA